MDYNGCTSCKYKLSDDDVCQNDLVHQEYSNDKLNELHFRNGAECDFYSEVVPSNGY